MPRWTYRLLARSNAVLACAALLAGCALIPGQPDEPLPLADALFDAPPQMPRADQVMALDAGMRGLLVRLAASPGGGASTPLQRLLGALYGSRELMLDYDGRITRSASEAFAAKSGNCLSLVLMTAAFARELGLPVRFNAAQVDDQWHQQGSLLLRSGHVNLTLGNRSRAPVWRSDGSNETMVDFLPPEALRGLRTQPIAEATVLAMYFNNRAAESLAAGRTTDAYWFARQALLQDAGFDAAMNTLAVVYLRAGQTDLADRALGRLLDRDPAHTSALANLALVRDAQGRTADADALRVRRARLEPHAPLQWLAEGLLALRRGDGELARRMFEREITHSGSSVELQFGLAQAYWRLGQPRLAEHALARAVEDSADAAERARLGAKIAWLRAHAVQ